MADLHGVFPHKLKRSELMKIQALLTVILFATPLALHAQSGPTNSGVGTTESEIGTTGTTTANPNDQQMVNMNDRQSVLTRIHAVNQFEIETAKIAQARSQSAEVKNYAKMLQQDHLKADKKVLSFADRQGLKLTAPPRDADEQKTLDRLNTLRGRDFDQAYLDAMEDGHQKAIRMVTQARTNLDDKATKDFLSQILPELQHHERMAYRIEDRVLGSNRAGKASESSKAGQLKQKDESLKDQNNDQQKNQAPSNQY